METDRILPFYRNQGRRCAQTLMKSVIQEEISLQRLDELTGRNVNQITIPLQIAYGFYRLKKNFIYPTKLFFDTGTLEDLKIKVFNEFGEENGKRINFKFIKEIWEELRKERNYLLRDNFNISEIEEYLQRGKFPITLINYDRFVGREDKKRGHYVLINDLRKDLISIMDCGPCNATPKRWISKNRLEDSLIQTPLDWGVVFC